MIAGPVIVLVLAVEIEDDRNALARIVVVIAAEEEAVRIVGIVVAIVVRQIQIRLVDALLISPSSVLIIFEPIT